MYTAFNVSTNLATVQQLESPESLSLLQELTRRPPPASANTRSSIQQRITSMLDPDGTINADRMREDWFPEAKSNVFLSHAHADKKLADALVLALERRFGITCFVDADVWGYIGTLQKAIDERWSRKITEGSGTLYDYQKVLASSAHVHMMLLSALAKMMDSSECLMFLNTPASVAVKDATTGASATFSSWIYGEAALSSIIRRRHPSEHRPRRVRAVVESFEDELPGVKYKLPLDHMRELGNAKLLEWNRTPVKGATSALDALYKLTDSPN